MFDDIDDRAQTTLQYQNVDHNWDHQYSFLKMRETIEIVVRYLDLRKRVNTQSLYTSTYLSTNLEERIL